MNLHNNLKKSGFNKVYISPEFDSLNSGNARKSLEKLIKSNPNEQVRLFRANNDLMSMGVNYTYLEPEKTFRVSGSISLKNYNNLNGGLWQIERNFYDHYPEVHKQASALLSSRGLILGNEKDKFNLGNGRYIDGSGTFFLYFSDCYEIQGDSKEIINLLKEEIAIASISIASLFDMFNVIARNKDSNLSEEIYSHFGNKIELTNGLAEKYSNRKATDLPSIDLMGLKEADKIILGFGNSTGISTRH